MAETFDIIVIGGGPGGYAAAIRCAQKGRSVAIVEKNFMGGTCLNCGCIPSKALLASVHLLTLAKHAPLMGIDIESIRPNWPKIQARKNAIVTGFRKGIAGLVQNYKIQTFNGTGIATSPGNVKVYTSSGTQELHAKKIILATGSEPVEIAAFTFNGQTIINSTDALNLPDIPSSMVIIGGGVIGCEMACVYATAGAKVTIVEALSQILPNEDPWVGQTIAKELKKLGIDPLTSQKVTSVEKNGLLAKVKLQSGQVIEAQKVLVAVGRQPTCDKETLDSLGLDTNGLSIKTNDKMETNVPGVYAIGDVVGTTYLAHGAFAEAHVAATNATGGNEKIGDYDLVPRAVYTFPEVASIGKNETKCKNAGIETIIGKSFFKYNGRSVAHNETVGEIHIIKEKSTNKILGITIVGATATELIATARAIIGSTEDITKVSFAHPTVSEVLKEAWEDAFGLSLHNPPK